MSSFLSGFSNLFSVGNTISQNANTNPNDVLNTKNALAQTGDYQVPDFGITDIPDMGMIDGLKKFQQKNGLKVDGVMKPGGPTESKIGEKLAGQGVSTVDPLASKTSKPKPSTITPLTGLSEIKMPKLRKPANAMWEQTGNQQKKNANPWFKSTKLQPVSDEAHAENTRTMDGMLNYSENGFLPTLYADAVKDGGDKAIAEYANFLNQLSDRKQERVNGFEQDVMNRLPVRTKQVILALAEQGENDPAAQKSYIISDSTTKPIINNAIEANSESEEERPKDELDKECDRILSRIEQINSSIELYEKHHAKSVEMLEKLGQNGQDLFNDIKGGILSLLPGKVADVIIGLLESKSFREAVGQLSDWADDIADVVDIITNIRLLSQNDGRLEHWLSVNQKSAALITELTTEKNGLIAVGSDKGCEIHGV